MTPLLLPVALERDLYLDALERLIVTEYNADHDGADWDTASHGDRFAHCLDLGLDPRVARAVATHTESTAPAGACVHCGGPGIRCCEHAPAR